jgi:hypothetical protein
MKRYELYERYLGARDVIADMKEAADGDWVLYDDAEAAIAAVEAAIAAVEAAIAAVEAAIAAVEANAKVVCDSYADENQRLFDRAEKAEEAIERAALEAKLGERP